MKLTRAMWIVVAIMSTALLIIVGYFIYQWYRSASIRITQTDIADTSNDTSMQDIITFIKSHEGGWVNDPDDQGGETNKGITYRTWCSVFGTNQHDRFLAMSDDDWYAVFKPKFWDVIKGDSIQSVPVANFLVDWNWGSGAYAVGLEYHGVYYGIQPVLNSLGNNLTVDGAVGPNTLAAINAADPAQLLQSLHDNRLAFYNAVVVYEPQDSKFLTGWVNRLNDLLA